MGDRGLWYFKMTYGLKLWGGFALLITFHNYSRDLPAAGLKQVITSNRLNVNYQQSHTLSLLKFLPVLALS